MLNNLYKWCTYVGVKTSALPGWSTRGSTSFKPTIVLAHWIAGPRNVALGCRPSLQIIRDGHSTLPGPLAQGYLARDGSAVMVAAGRANHAGKGLHMGVTGNTGAAGWEAECADAADWTEQQRRAWPLVLIATMFAMWEKGNISWDQITAGRAVGHSEFALPRGRKIDINGFTTDELRKEISRLIPEFKKRVNGKPIKVGTAPVFDIDTARFTDGTRVAIGGAGAPPAGPAPSTKPVIKRAWPDVQLPVLSYHTAASHSAWVKVLAGVGFRDSKLTTAMQRWLKSLGYYRGFIDGSFGKMTARALQTFLKAKGHYRGLVDGARGPLTVRAEVAYLNAQARYYKES
ncbi:peptidoglycan recognition protein family protein [Micrococcus terreus]|uniref:peptidoglycan recognition protein family protein n=1 Tax=Micrococcus terreus TaxID=574650 RepID=UPI00254DD4C2|nr:peptidoglycan-binding domain-containing protein [Micrococcus terreus]MDK7701478.1 peptidoglycan-binding domain-containing protein [Micrococcus terreus]WOO98178.1 peptidoglycan-binding domain-containing protein [Micrococcus terreus]